jgi:hypothetical protein
MDTIVRLEIRIPARISFVRPPGNAQTLLPNCPGSRGRYRDASRINNDVQ